jgi:succinate-acetate transporter protein
MSEVRTTAPPVAVPAIANPAALGLAGFALTTFVLSTHNAGLAPDLTWVGLAFFYGGLAQFCAGMWEFKANNTFGATAFSTYGAFWLALATFVVLLLAGKVPSKDVNNDLGWFLLAFFIFNSYMLILSTRVSIAVFGVFLTLEITELLLWLGFFGGNTGLIQLGGWVGIITAIVAWYTSFATVANSQRARAVLWVGNPLWP